MERVVIIYRAWNFGATNLFLVPKFQVRVVRVFEKKDKVVGSSPIGGKKIEKK